MVKVKVSYLTSVAEQAKTSFLHGPTVWKSPILGIEPRNLSLRKRCTNHCTTPPPPPLCEAIGRFRSIATWAHSNLIFGSYGHCSVAIFRVHAAERQMILLTLWKYLRSAEKVLVLALWRCASLHPRNLQWSCTQFLSWCLVCWAGSERFASAQFQLRSRWQSGCTSIFGLERTLPCWESLEVCQRPGDSLEMQRRKQHTLLFWPCVRILPDDFSLWLFFVKFFSVPRTFGFVFRDQWDKSFQTSKCCNQQKCFFSLIKAALVGLYFFQFCTPNSGLTKG